MLGVGLIVLNKFRIFFGRPERASVGNQIVFWKNLKESSAAGLRSLALGLTNKLELFRRLHGQV
jgi:hypothetical protein